MDRSWLNQINREPRINPGKALQNLRRIEQGIATSDLHPKVKSLRTHSLKREREIRDACLFCYGMSCRLGQPVWVYPKEDADFDFVAAWEVGGERHFAPTQLKELVSSKLNSKATLQEIIDGLAKYQVSDQLTVAIHLNRVGRFEPEKLAVPKLGLAALWLFGAVTEDQSRWRLYGNILQEAEFSEFEYPH